LLAPALFAICLVVFGALRPDYSHLTDAVSGLGARGAPNAEAWNLLGFVTVGLLITAFSWGLFRGTGSLSALLFVGLSGLGFAGTGVFPADMSDLSSPSSRAHILMSLISFAAFVPGAFVLGWRLLGLPGWKRIGIGSIALGLLALVTMPLREIDVPPGLAQRAAFAVYLLWIGLLAVGLRAAYTRRP
jgi:hypothetical membrane protein